MRTSQTIAATVLFAAFSLPLSSLPARAANALPVACQSLHSADALPDELAAYQAAPADCLKSMFMRCSAVSERQALFGADAIACSLGHEALLKGVFGGDFDALLAWWRDERAAAVTQQ